MLDKPLEKDWKTFKVMAPELRERYLRARNEELLSILTNEQLSETERFWDVEEQAGKIAKILRSCLDGHSRSKMEFFMMVMLTQGMMTKDDLAAFSEEVRERLSFVFHE